MKAEKAVGYILKNTAGVTALAGQRIYNLIAPQDALFPYVVFGIAPHGVEPYDTKTGAADLDRVRFEIHSFAGQVDKAALLDEACRAALDRYPHGAVNGVTLDGIQYITTNAFSEPDLSSDGGNVIFHYVSEFGVRVKY